MKTRKPWFDANGNLARRIPKQCVSDCSHSGDCELDCERWVSNLGFDVPRARAVSYLREYGAWTVEELNGKTDSELARVVLWIACGDIKETGEWFGLIH